MDQVNESAGGVPSRAQSSTDQSGQARQKSVWGSLLPPKSDQSNRSNEDNDQDDSAEQERSPRDEIVDDESVAFENVLEPAQILWLQSFDLTNDQLKAIECTPVLGINAALSMISLAVEKAEDLDRLKALTEENKALRSLMKRESGWSETYMKDKINETLALMSSLVEIPLGPLRKDESTMLVGGTSTRAALVTFSEEKALRINDVTPENMQQFADHLRRALARGVDDNRLGVLSTDAIAQIHCTLQAKLSDRVPLDATSTLWMSQQTARKRKHAQVFRLLNYCLVTRSI